MAGLIAGFISTSCTSEDPARALEAELEKAKWTVQKAEAQQAELVEQLHKEPTTEHLLAVLATNHSQARAFLGPHRLSYTANFSLQPESIPELPEVDRPRPQAYAIEDQLVLTWASQPDEAPQFHLSQGNEELDYREVMLLDERVYTRLPFRGWFVHHQETDFYERWLADAQRSLFDVIEFAAPSLAFTLQKAEDDGDITLILTQNPVWVSSLTASGVNRQWRSQIKFTNIHGQITLHPQLGLWTSGEVDLTYEFTSSDNQISKGTLHWSGRVEALSKTAAEQAIVVPTTVEPVPERLRYEVEKAHLLNGLAGLP